MNRDDYQRGYDEGYDDAHEDGWKEAYDRGWEDALDDRNILTSKGSVDNLCLKCDCKEHGFDCILENPRSYMEQKIENGDKKSRKRKRVNNPDFDRAMEIFYPE